MKNQMTWSQIQKSKQETPAEMLLAGLCMVLAIASFMATAIILQ